jgi:LysM repeat protein
LHLISCRHLKKVSDIGFNLNSNKDKKGFSWTRDSEGHAFEDLEIHSDSPKKKNKLNKNQVLALALLFAGAAFGLKAFESFYADTSVTNVEIPNQTIRVEEEKVQEYIIASSTVREENENTGNEEEPTEAMSAPEKLQEKVVVAQAQALVWSANDYVEGDIEPGDYTVQEGDTLWEIAEAVYGNGADWVNILNANSDDIGFLADGSQALITTGQTLTIPSV